MGNDCLMTIDGTDYRILQKGAARKGNAFGSFKYAGKSALRYELRVDILAGNLTWVPGPYPAGTSEVAAKTILMGHPVSSCHVPVVRLCFILFHTLILS